MMDTHEIGGAGRLDSGHDVSIAVLYLFGCIMIIGMGECYDLECDCD